jgi:hypothetical protein
MTAYCRWCSFAILGEATGLNFPARIPECTVGLVLAVFKEVELGFIGSHPLSCGRLLFRMDRGQDGAGLLGMGVAVARRPGPALGPVREARDLSQLLDPGGYLPSSLDLSPSPAMRWSSRSSRAVGWNARANGLKSYLGWAFRDRERPASGIASQTRGRAGSGAARKWRRADPCNSSRLLQPRWRGQGL